MQLDRIQWSNRFVKRPFIGGPVIGGLVAILAVSGSIVASSAHADPADDAMAKLSELSRQAEQTSEAMYTAQLDLDTKLAAQQVAEDKLAADQAAVDTANAEFASYQSAVNKMAGVLYMGGRTDSLSALLTARSPQQLIDKLSTQQLMATQMATQMKNFRATSARAAQAQAASERSTTEARTAAEQAEVVRSDVQAKQRDLAVKIAVVKSQYMALTPDQRTALADPAPEAMPLPNVLPGPAPEAAVPPGDVGAPVVATPGTGGERSATVIQAALSRIGSPYSWGGSGPNAFDCSGLIMWAFQSVGVSLPHSSQAMATGGQPVSMSDMQPGDVVTYYSDASHAGIYIGDGMMVHSSTYGTPVRVAPVANAPIYNVRRY